MPRVSAPVGRKLGLMSKASGGYAGMIGDPCGLQTSSGGAEGWAETGVAQITGTVDIFLTWH